MEISITSFESSEKHSYARSIPSGFGPPGATEVLVGASLILRVVIQTTYCSLSIASLARSAGARTVTEPTARMAEPAAATSVHGERSRA